MARTLTKTLGTLTGVVIVVAAFNALSPEEPRLPSKKQTVDIPMIVRWDVVTSERTDVMVTSHSTIHGNQVHYKRVIPEGSPNGVIMLKKNEVLSLTVTASQVPPIRAGEKRLMCTIDANSTRIDVEQRETYGTKRVSVLCQGRIKG